MKREDLDRLIESVKQASHVSDASISRHELLDEVVSALTEIHQSWMPVPEEARDYVLRRIIRAERIANGEKIVPAHWNQSDNCYEVFCSKCDRHLYEHHGDEDDLPFENDAICLECQKTPEELAEERKLEKAYHRVRQLVKLRELADELGVEIPNIPSETDYE